MMIEYLKNGNDDQKFHWSKNIDCISKISIFGILMGQ